MSGSKRVKITASSQRQQKDTGDTVPTATTTSPPADADPIQSVMANPDTLSKALLCLDVQDISAAARTCKVWNATLDSIADVLWLGLVRKHHPTLVTIRSMLLSNDGGIASWKDDFKRRRTIKAPELIHPPPAKPLDSYVFEVICKPYVADGMPLGEGELATVPWSAGFFQFSSGTRLRLAPFEVLDGSFVLSVRIHDRFTGRQAVLLDRWYVPMSPHTGCDAETVGGLVHCRSEESEQVEVRWYAKPGLHECVKGFFALELSFSVHMYQEQGGRAHINKSAKLASSQILDMLQNHLDWK